MPLVLLEAWSRIGRMMSLENKQCNRLVKKNKAFMAALILALIVLDKMDSIHFFLSLNWAGGLSCIFHRTQSPKSEEIK